MIFLCFLCVFYFAFVDLCLYSTRKVFVNWQLCLFLPFFELFCYGHADWWLSLWCLMFTNDERPNLREIFYHLFLVFLCLYSKFIKIRYPSGTVFLSVCINKILINQAYFVQKKQIILYKFASTGAGSSISRIRAKFNRVMRSEPECIKVHPCEVTPKITHSPSRYAPLVRAGKTSIYLWKYLFSYQTLSYCCNMSFHASPPPDWIVDDHSHPCFSKVHIMWNNPYISSLVGHLIFSSYREVPVVVICSNSSRRVNG